MITLLQKDSFKFDNRSDKYARFETKNLNGIDCILKVIDYKLSVPSDIKHHLYFLEGRTGSGKSTCLPMNLFKHLARTLEFVKINVLQPRVVLAQSIPLNITEIDPFFRLGYNIGYSTGSGSINAVEPNKITFMTTDIFRYKLTQKKSLGNIVIVDECHEMDIPMITLLKQIKDYVCDLSIPNEGKPIFIFASATINIDAMVKYFFKDVANVYNDVNMIGYISGSRNFPVDEHFLMSDFKNDDEFLNFVFSDVLKNSLKSTITWNSIPCRDILIFAYGSKFFKLFDDYVIKSKNHINMPVFVSHYNVDDEANVLKWRNANRNKKRVLILSYMSGCIGFSSKLLSNSYDHDTEAQQNEIKIYLSSNVLETGKTINTWYQIIDTGLRLMVVVNPLLYTPLTQNIIKCPIDQSASIQRCGRVGRKCSGVSIRIFTESTWNKMSVNGIPCNIFEPSAAGMLLTCRNSNEIADFVNNNDYIEPNSFDTNLISGQDLVVAGYSTPFGLLIDDIHDLNDVPQKWILQSEYDYYINNTDLFETLVNNRLNRQLLNKLMIPDNNLSPHKFDIITNAECAGIYEARQEYVKYLVGKSKIFKKIQIE